MVLYTRAFAVATVALVFCSGCEAMRESVDWLVFPGSSNDTELVNQHRDQFQIKRSPESLRWLLANKVRSGMTRGDVNELLGEKGQREFNANWILGKGTTYRQTDEVYRWGPDANGQSIYLVFRDDHLTSFDPTEFE